MVHFRSGAAARHWTARRRRRCGRSWRTSCAKRSAAAGSRPASGCRRSRALAAHLGLSRGLVQECYAQLLAEGYLISRGGSATRVAQRGVRAAAPSPAFATAGSRPTTDRRLPRACPTSASPRARTGPGRCARPAAPPRTAPSTTATPRGDRRLREVLAGLPAPGARGRRPTPTGSSSAPAIAQGLATRAARARRRRRRKLVAVEDPGLGRHDDRGGRAPRAATACPCRSTSTAWTSPRSAASGARAVVVTPAHQWPTGVVLAPAAPARAASRGRGARRRHHRGRLRRRVPLRPRAGRLAAGARARPRRLARHGQQVARAGAAARLGGRCPRACSHAGRRGQAGRRPRRARPRPARAGRADRVRALRPAPAPHARRVRHPPRHARRRPAAHAPASRVTGLAAGFHAVAHLPTAPTRSRSSRGPERAVSGSTA